MYFQSVYSCLFQNLVLILYMSALLFLCSFLLSMVPNFEYVNSALCLQYLSSSIPPICILHSFPRNGVQFLKTLCHDPRCIFSSIRCPHCCFNSDFNFHGVHLLIKLFDFISL